MADHFSDLRVMKICLCGILWFFRVGLRAEGFREVIPMALYGLGWGCVWGVCLGRGLGGWVCAAGGDAVAAAA